MKKIIHVAVFGVVFFLGNTAYAASYPIAPPNPSNDLSLFFISSVPDESQTGGDPNPAIGNNIYQHPGGFRFGDPEPGAYFIGVFDFAASVTSPTNTY